MIHEPRNNCESLKIRVQILYQTQKDRTNLSFVWISLIVFKHRVVIMGLIKDKS